MKPLIDELRQNQILKKEDFLLLLNQFNNPDIKEYLFATARKISEEHFKGKIYIRGLIEFTNYCQNDCFYCGIRMGNKNAQRYRLSKEEILACCKQGYQLGFRTFVLQGGEDPYFSDEQFIDIVQNINKSYPDCAITLSVGEKNYESYLNLFKAGANRYLLRHETAQDKHYKLLHPNSLSLSNRKQCLYNLKQIGYQVGTGFMVGSPYQKLEYIIDDLFFIKELSPHMIGIGPFIPHQDTPFSQFPAGSVDLTVFLLAILRIMLPKVLLPATTALASLDEKGREKGILAGANVVMPNLSPLGNRKKYSLYNNKAATGQEAAEYIDLLSNSMNKIGYQIVKERGDYKE